MAKNLQDWAQIHPEQANGGMEKQANLVSGFQSESGSETFAETENKIKKSYKNPNILLLRCKNNLWNIFTVTDSEGRLPKTRKKSVFPEQTRHNGHNLTGRNNGYCDLFESLSSLTLGNPLSKNLTLNCTTHYFCYDKSFINIISIWQFNIIIQYNFETIKNHNQAPSINDVAF